MFRYLLALLVVVVIGAGLYLNHILPVASSYSAKIMCSCVFVGDRNPEEVQVQELANLFYTQSEVNREAKTVTSSVYGLKKRTAIYREGLGCTLVSGMNEETLSSQSYQNPQIPKPDSLAFWPMGDLDTTSSILGVDSVLLAAAMDHVMAEQNPELPKWTRAALVVYRGKIIAERYADGYDAQSKLMGWSMTKSVTNAFIGLLVKDGKLDIMEPAPVPEWSDPADPRHAITTDQLLRMSSGLEFDENYGTRADATEMLFLQPDAGTYAVNKPLIHEPGTFWDYSSGTTNILARMVKDQFPDRDAYMEYVYSRLFRPLGMYTTTIEPDASGTFVGSSYMYASARDWARFGLLYLQDGQFNGQQILPEGWTTYSGTRTPTAPHGEYSAQFWNNATSPTGEITRRYWPEVPEDAYYCSGFEGQNVVIIPSRDVVIVRLGLSHSRAAWDVGTFLEEVLAALPDSEE
ncbi:serine hydrolase [Pontibacter sp. G13]|uniref:serine hydrolase domain-containing protein n=1 Tax=Pontibacter sp. G13 TaxID=3074898 RepID=UPI002889A2EB|nr:serine hydrolase [Pontibacter sp. G13]WNJ18940.1 serine hydrolase [Pontibacter sp. G13]